MAKVFMCDDCGTTSKTILHVATLTVEKAEYDGSITETTMTLDLCNDCLEKLMRGVPTKEASK